MADFHTFWKQQQKVHVDRSLVTGSVLHFVGEKMWWWVGGWGVKAFMTKQTEESTALDATAAVCTIYHVLRRTHWIHWHWFVMKTCSLNEVLACVYND